MVSFGLELALKIRLVAILSIVTGIFKKLQKENKIQ